MERTGPLSLTLALQITKQIGDALSYAHENGVFHETLDPKHIFYAQIEALKFQDLV